MLPIKSHTFLLLCLVVTLVGCVSGTTPTNNSAPDTVIQRPSWLSQPPQEEDYFYGVGLDKNLDTAKLKSQVNIALQLSSRVESSMKLSSESRSYYSINKQITDGVVMGCKFFDQYYDGNYHWILTRAPLNCVLDMTEAVLISYLLQEKDKELMIENDTIVNRIVFAVDQIDSDLRYNVQSFLPQEIQMVEVAGGSFRYGKDLFGNPGKQVSISTFLMGKYEITQREWDLVLGRNTQPSNNQDLPVNNVSWYEALEFCNRLSLLQGLTPCYSGEGERIRCDLKADGYRLPTEAEWEFAARGGNLSEDFLYSGSDRLMEVGWYRRNSGTRLLSIEELTEDSWTNNIPQSVGQLQPNELGLYDMSGNMREWCWDWQDDIQQLSSRDPIGRERGTNRGGSFDYWEEEQFRVYARNGNNYPLDGRYNFIGFRVVRRVAD